MTAILKYFSKRANQEVIGEAEVCRLTQIVPRSIVSDAGREANFMGLITFAAGKPLLDLSMRKGDMEKVKK